MEKFKIYDVIIIGGGASGLTAGIYTSRGGLNTLLLEKGTPGGLALTANLIENYPGFPDGINGMDLMDRFKRQAQKFGVQIIQSEVKNVKPTKMNIEVLTDKGAYNALCVIIATGSIPKELNVPGENEFAGKGVSYCATCDAPFYKDKKVAVIGGGDVALEEALFLTKFAKKVFHVHRRDAFRAISILQQQVKENEKIDILYSHTLTEITGSHKVEAIKIKDEKTHQVKKLDMDGVFIFIGSRPNSEIVKDLVKTDENGFIITDADMQTSKKGIFAVGDVRSKKFRQVVLACGEGAQAGLRAYKYLDENSM